MAIHVSHDELQHWSLYPLPQKNGRHCAATTLDRFLRNAELYGVLSSEHEGLTACLPQCAEDAGVQCPRPAFIIIWTGMRVPCLVFIGKLFVSASWKDGLLIHEVSRSHTTTHRSRQDSPGRVISPSHRPLPDNTQHSQQTDIHRTPLDKWSARRRDLYLTIYNTHNRQTSIELLWTSDQPVAQTATWQYTTLTTDRHP